MHRLWRDWLQRPRQAKGKLIQKQEAVPAQASIRYGALGASSVQSSVLIFDVQGHLRHFDVSPLLYDRMAIGQEGILTYQGRRLLDFDNIAESDDECMG